MSWQDESVAAVQKEVIGVLSSSKLRSKAPLLFEAWRGLSPPERDEYESELGNAISKVFAEPEAK